MLVHSRRQSFNTLLEPEKQYKGSNYSIKTGDVKKNLPFKGFLHRDILEKPLSLVYMGDTHCNIDHIPGIKTAIKTAKQLDKNTLVIHSGDFGLGASDLGLQVGILNNLEVDMATLGNHEFFVGMENLTSALQKAEFKTIVSNLTIPENNPLKQLEKDKQLVKTEIRTINGTKYGFIGATTPDINKNTYTQYTDGVFATIPEKAIFVEIKKLEEQGINKIILISHLGYVIDKQIAQTVPGIDVIVGGHSHTKLNGIQKDTNLFKSARNNEPVLLLHSGEYAENIGFSHLIFNKKGVLQVNELQSNLKKLYMKTLGKMTSSINLLKQVFSDNSSTDNELLPTNQFIKDQETIELLKSNLTKVASTKKGICADWPTWVANELGSLTADAVRGSTRSQIALIQPSGLRRNITRGPVYAEYIKNQVIPFDTEIVKVKLTGKQILQALNHAAESAGTLDKPGLLQVSGLKYVYDMLRPPHDRVIPQEVYVKTGNVYRIIDPKETYTVAYDKFLYNGGEGFDSLMKAEIIKQYPGLTQASALVEYLEKHGCKDKNILADYQQRIIARNMPRGTVIDKLHELQKLKYSIQDKIVDIAEFTEQSYPVKRLSEKFPAIAAAKDAITRKIYGFIDNVDDLIPDKKDLNNVA